MVLRADPVDGSMGGQTERQNTVQDGGSLDTDLVVEEGILGRSGCYKFVVQMTKH